MELFLLQKAVLKASTFQFALTIAVSITFILPNFLFGL
jgi:hypothetical protein